MKQQNTHLFSALMWLAFLYWMGTVFMLTSAPPSTFSKPGFFFQLPEFIKNIPNLDKFIHFSFYFGAMFFLTIAVQTSPKGVFRGNQKIAFIAVTLLVLAAMGELKQLYIPGRTADLWDFVANLTGGAVAIWIVYLLFSRLKQQKSLRI
ncbi:MAG: VanZ family protein [Sumerlaeia bacterium]